MVTLPLDGTGWRCPRRLGKGFGTATRTSPPRSLLGQRRDASAREVTLQLPAGAMHLQCVVVFETVGRLGVQSRNPLDCLKMRLIRKAGIPAAYGMAR